MRAKYSTQPSKTWRDEGFPGFWGTREHWQNIEGNISHFLGTGEQNSKNYKGEQITKMSGNMGT